METLKALTLNKDGGLVLRRYELRLLTILGYAPELDSCVVCRASSFQGGASFNSSAGGLVCPSCAEDDGAARPISRDALISFRYLRNTDPSAIAEKVTPERLAGEMELILGRYIRYQLEREVRSAGFLDRLASLPSGDSKVESQCLFLIVVLDIVEEHAKVAMIRMFSSVAAKKPVLYSPIS